MLMLLSNSEQCLVTVKIDSTFLVKALSEQDHPACFKLSRIVYLIWASAFSSSAWSFSNMIGHPSVLSSLAERLLMMSLPEYEAYSAYKPRGSKACLGLSCAKAQ
jgi:hypothetical protein